MRARRVQLRKHDAELFAVGSTALEEAKEQGRRRRRGRRFLCLVVVGERGR